MPDERTLVADIKSYIGELPGFSADVEERQSSGLKRLDLIVRYKGNILFNGEFKKPTAIEGRNPRSADLVYDAHIKSQTLQQPSQFFITSNFNETVIWSNRKAETRPLMSRDVETVELPLKINDETDFERNDIKEALRETFKKIAEKILKYYQNLETVEYLPLGDSFIKGLNSHLNTAAEMAYKYIKIDVLKRWWDEQEYEPVTKFTDTEKKRLSKFSMYVLANRILFYYVLKRTFKELKEIDLGNEENINVINKIIHERFAEAKSISGDYETVFEESEVDKIPFSSNDLSHSIKSLILFFQLYDFSTMSQDLLGNIYDTLISPNERHQNGQYFTPIPVVDLINAFTIKSTDSIVLDPACGSGTFLTKAFDLKLYLAHTDNKRLREKLIKELIGVDIASYPAHLATVALSSKMALLNPKVYPQIIRNDFLNVEPRKENTLLNTELTIKGLNKKNYMVSIEKVDAVVSNLPYIRQENIKNKESEREKIRRIFNKFGIEQSLPNKTSDFHAYFWYYILPFLHEGSRVGFLTSDTWLNVRYGNDLKKFINKYFKVIAIIDSSVERYFPDALVNTIITILERTDNQNAISNNKIKFAKINKKLDKLIEVSQEEESQELTSAMKLVNQIEKGISTQDVTIVREVRQGDLNFDNILKSKLFPYLRAPDEFFELINNENMIPLKKVMDVRFGIKTGANKFFYVKDVTDKYNEPELKSVFGISKADTKKLRIIKDGTGQEHVIEAKYLKPILKSPKEFTTYGRLEFDKPTSNYVVLIEDNATEIGEYAKKYIRYGEKQGYNLRPSCKNRYPWWKLSPIIYPDIVFTMYFSSVFLYPKTNYLLDHTMYFGKMHNNYKDDLLSVYAFLNSSLSYLYPDLFGRNYGGGGAPVGFMVYEAQILPVPKPEILRPYYEEIKRILASMASRKIGSVFEELWDGEGTFSIDKVKEDRLALDRVILKALGYEDPDNFLIKWYPTIVKIVKERLEKAKSFKTAKKSSRISLSKIADNIIKEIKLKKFPDDYVTDKMGMIKIEIGSKVKIGKDLNGTFVSFDGNKKYYESEELARYVYYCAILGIEDIPIPTNVKLVLEKFIEDVKSINSELNIKINTITENDEYRKKLYNLCIRKLGLSQIITYLNNTV